MRAACWRRLPRWMRKGLRLEPWSSLHPTVRGKWEAIAAEYDRVTSTGDKTG